MTTAYTTARNQLNVQLELDGSVWTGLFDSRDIDRYAGSNETWLVEEFGQAKVDELFPDGVRADCFGDRDCRGKFAHSTRTCKSGQRRCCARLWRLQKSSSNTRGSAPPRGKIR